MSKFGTTKVTILTVLLASALGAAVQQNAPRPQQQNAPAAPQPPQPPGTGVMSGTVVRAGSGEPVSGAVVEIRKTDCNNFNNPPEVLTATTTGSGQFTFQNLRPGGWCVVATHPSGQLNPAEFQQRGPKGRGVTINLADGQRMENVRLSMMETGGISGRVIDYDGEPLGHARVQLLEPFYQDGQRRLYILQVVQSDDRGEYRFFWLPPGRYFVAVIPEDSRRNQAAFTMPPPGVGGHREDQMSPILIRRILKSGDVVEDTYVTVYYPGANDSRSAVPVEVRSGASTSGIDVNLAGAKVRAYHIRGHVVSAATGMPAANAQLRLFPRDWTSMVITPSATANADGDFDIAGVVPGSYVLYASLAGTGGARGGPPDAVPAPAAPRGAPNPAPLGGTGLGGAAGGARGGQNATRGQAGGAAAQTGQRGQTGPPPVPPVMGRVAIEMGSGHIEGLGFALTPGYAISGRIVVEGAAPDTVPRGLRISLARDPDLVGLPSATINSNVQTNGTFTFPDVGQGDYRVYVQPLVNPFQWGAPNVPQQIENAYVKSIRLGGADVLAEGLHLSDPPRDGFNVVIATGGKVEGRAVNDRQEPVVNATIAVVPDPLSLRRRSDLYRTATTDSAGRFQIKGLPPGDYKAFAWEDVERDAWQDTEFMRPYEARGRTFHVGAGEAASVETTVIPPGR